MFSHHLRRGQGSRVGRSSKPLNDDSPDLSSDDFAHLPPGPDQPTNDLRSFSLDDFEGFAHLQASNSGTGIVANPSFEPSPHAGTHPFTLKQLNTDSFAPNENGIIDVDPTARPKTQTTSTPGMSYDPIAYEQSLSTSARVSPPSPILQDLGPQLTSRIGGRMRSFQSRTKGTPTGTANHWWMWLILGMILVVGVVGVIMAFREKRKHQTYGASTDVNIDTSRGVPDGFEVTENW